MKRFVPRSLVVFSIVASCLFAQNGFLGSRKTSAQELDRLRRTASRPLPRADALAPDLFISEYIEGTGNNLAIEIYNGTGADVDLAAGNYVLQRYTNGATFAASSANLDGVITNGDVYVISRNDASPAVAAQMDVALPTLITFDGNDTFVLRKGGSSGSIIDVFGQIGFNPGTAWGTGDTSTVDHTLVRKSNVCSGDPNGSNAFDPSLEWDGYAVDTASFIGSHTANCSANNPPVAGDDSVDGAVGTPSYVVNVLANDTSAPDAGETLTVTAVGAVSGGATASFTSTTVTITPLNASTPATYVTSYTISDGNGGTDIAAITLTVYDPPLVGGTDATNITTTSATLTATAVNQVFASPITAYFRYGLSDPGVCSDSFGVRAPTAGGIVPSGSGYSIGVEGLAPSTTYYYCFIATNLGGTTVGPVRSFATLAPRTLTVDTAADDPGLSACTSAPGDCSLRGAISGANDLDTIQFGIPSSEALPTVIILGGIDLSLTSDVTIAGPGADQLTIDAAGASRIFDVPAGVTAAISDLTLTGGNAATGGAIANSGLLNLERLRIVGNSATNEGGGIYNRSGSITILESTIANNTAGLEGGGIESLSFAIDTNAAHLVLTSSTVSGNAAFSGAGLHIQGSDAELSSSTVSGNSASGVDPTGGGAGLESVGFGKPANVIVRSCTFSGNTFTASPNPIAEAIYSGNFGTQSTVSLKNTIVDGDAGSAAPNLRVYSDGTLPGLGAITSNGFNLSSDDASAFLGQASDLNGTDPLLAPLADNGGPTETHAFDLSGGVSPAIDQGSQDGFAKDQRGEMRIADFAGVANGVGDGSDIGAFEFIIPSAAPVTISGRVTDHLGRGIQAATITITGAQFSESRTVRSNSFGYFHIDGIPAGESCVISVSARRYRFPEPTRLVNVSDDVAGLEFVASN